MNICFDATVRVHAETPEQMEHLLMQARAALGADFRSWQDNKTPDQMDIGELFYYAMSECTDDTGRDFLAATLADPTSGISVTFVPTPENAKVEL